MYLKEYFPFYTTYANPLLYEGERMQDKEFNLMKSYYPGTVQHIQEKIEEECDLMDYEGSLFKRNRIRSPTPAFTRSPAIIAPAPII